MAERKSVNKYYPPDWDPSKGSVNNYVGQHPLRERAKKLGLGILVIRFEMPYNIWCGGCNSHIGMGVRYNAEKSKTGMYYTTPIYKFRMKCHLCDNYFEIQTDPKNHDYVILEGARRKEQRWDPKENEQIVPEDKATQKKMATDSMFKLEHGSDDVKRGQKAISNLGSLELMREDWKDDYLLNKLARHKFREEKKSIKAVEAADDDLLSRSSLAIPLVEERAEDVKIAGLLKYRTLESYDEKQAQKRLAIDERPLFSDSKRQKTDTESSDSHKLDIIKQQIRRSKAGKAGGAPFDRMAMNSLCYSSTLKQNSLGIRRKSKDNMKLNTPTATSSTELEALENRTATDDSNTDGDSIQDITESEDTSRLIESSNVGTALDHDKVLTCSSSADKSLINSSGDDTLVHKNMVNGEGDKDVVTTETEGAGTSTVLGANTSLSLVCAYSDSDTDSNTS